MIFGLFRRGPQQAIAERLYAAIVAQSRREAFYRNLAVPDTLEGRFDMIVLHLVLLFRRLARDGGEERALAQDVFDMFCRDMDGNLREMGVGDLTVPKRMRGFAEAFYGRLAVYDRALTQTESASLARALARNVFGSEPAGEGAWRLAAYVRKAVASLDAQGTATIGEGTVVFPDLDAVMMPSLRMK